VKIILSAAFGVMLAADVSSAMAQTTPDPAAPSGQMAAHAVASSRGTAVHSRNRKPKHRVGAPGQAASPSVSADKGAASPNSGSAAPQNPSGAPAEAAAPSVQQAR
jgi:hypothetical protein